MNDQIFDLNNQKMTFTLTKMREQLENMFSLRKNLEFGYGYG